MNAPPPKKRKSSQNPTSEAVGKKDIRQKFRDAVFARDNHRYRGCGIDDGALDAHHITDRSEMPNGGYVIENGISLCAVCHQKAEVWHASGKTHAELGFHPDDLYRLIGSSHDAARRASEALSP
jgi:hypothetical protein